VPSYSPDQAVQIGAQPQAMAQQQTAAFAAQRTGSWGPQLSPQPPLPYAQSVGGGSGLHFASPPAAAAAAVPGQALQQAAGASGFGFSSSPTAADLRLREAELQAQLHTLLLQQQQQQEQQRLNQMQMQQLQQQQMQLRQVQQQQQQAHMAHGQLQQTQQLQQQQQQPLFGGPPAALFPSPDKQLRFLSPPPSMSSLPPLPSMPQQQQQPLSQGSSSWPSPQ